MRPVTAVTAAAASVGVVVLTWNAGETSSQVAVTPAVAAAPKAATPSAPDERHAPTSAPPGSAVPSTAPSGQSGAAGTPGTRSVTGPSVMTRYGAVQVQVVLTGTRIGDVVALHLTDSNRTSVLISAAAAPTLRQEALAAQSAQIDGVSGATYTSQGYQQSLQAALDAAHA